MFTFGVRRGIRGRELNRAMTASLAPAASILLIIGAGGGFKQVLIDTSRPLLVLAIGCGSLFLSHVNDAGFWLINQYFGMSVPDTFKTWSAMETVISVVGIVLVMAASLVV